MTKLTPYQTRCKLLQHMKEYGETVKLMLTTGEDAYRNFRSFLAVWNLSIDDIMEYIEKCENLHGLDYILSESLTAGRFELMVRLLEYQISLKEVSIHSDGCGFEWRYFETQRKIIHIAFLSKNSDVFRLVMQLMYPLHISEQAMLSTIYREDSFDVEAPLAFSKQLREWYRSGYQAVQITTKLGYNNWKYQHEVAETNKQVTIITLQICHLHGVEFAREMIVSYLSPLALIMIRSMAFKVNQFDKYRPLTYKMNDYSCSRIHRFFYCFRELLQISAEFMELNFKQIANKIKQMIFTISKFEDAICDRINLKKNLEFVVPLMETARSLYPDFQEVHDLCCRTHKIPWLSDHAIDTSFVAKKVNALSAKCDTTFSSAFWWNYKICKTLKI